MTDTSRIRCFAILAAPVLVVAALVAYSSGPDAGPDRAGRMPWVQQIRVELLAEPSVPPSSGRVGLTQDVPALDGEQARHEGDDRQTQQERHTGPVPSVHDGDLGKGPAEGRDLR